MTKPKHIETTTTKLFYKKDVGYDYDSFEYIELESLGKWKIKSYFEGDILFLYCRPKKGLFRFKWWYAEHDLVFKTKPKNTIINICGE